MHAGANLDRTSAVETLAQLSQCTAYDACHVLPLVCRHGNIRLATILLEKCSGVQLDDESIKALHASLRVVLNKRNAALIRAILPLIPNQDCPEHLYSAIRRGDWDIAEVLVSSGRFLPIQED